MKIDLKHVLILGSFFLSSCLPSVTSYTKFDVPEAEYLRDRCTGKAGPPTLVYYRFHEIYISLFLRTLLIGVHIPAGNVVYLEDPTIAIDAASKTGAFKKTYKLRAAPHSAVFPRSPPKFASQPDLYTSSDNFGPLSGGTQGTVPSWYLFLAMDAENPGLHVRVPKDLKNGTVRLPAMSINGQRFESQTVQFTLDTFAGLSSINCS